MAARIKGVPAGSALFRTKQTSKSEVYQMLKEAIISDKQRTGEHLLPIKQLARKFKTSVFTIQSALYQLENEGYVETRHGHGTVIVGDHRPATMADTVSLLIRTRGDLWSDICGLLLEKFASRGLSGLFLEYPQNLQAIESMLRRLSHTPTKALIIEDGQGLGLEASVLEYLPLCRKKIIGLLKWDAGPTSPNIFPVVTDAVYGGKIVAEHLWELGHRRVLVLGTSTMIPIPPSGNRSDVSGTSSSFAAEWSRRGGHIEAMASKSVPGPGADMGYDEERFFSFFRHAPPTAIFALRDIEAWAAQNLLSKRNPALWEKTAIVGYFNTPWSNAGHPAITTVSLDVEAMVDRVMIILDHIEPDKKEIPEPVLVKPKLIVRSTSFPAMRA